MDGILDSEMKEISALSKFVIALSSDLDHFPAFSSMRKRSNQLNVDRDGE